MKLTTLTLASLPHTLTLKTNLLPSLKKKKKHNKIKQINKIKMTQVVQPCVWSLKLQCCVCRIPSMKIRLEQIFEVLMWIVNTSTQFKKPLTAAIFWGPLLPLRVTRGACVSLPADQHIYFHFNCFVITLLKNELTQKTLLCC